KFNDLYVFKSDQSFWKSNNEINIAPLCKLVNDVSNLLDRILVAAQELRKVKETQKESTTKNDGSEICHTELDCDKSKLIVDDGYIRQEHERYLTFAKKSQLSSI